MIKNHLRSFLRNLSRNKGYAFINISGLAVGFAAALLISIYVYQEYNYDRHHNEYEHIYRMSSPTFGFSSTAHVKYLIENTSEIESWVSMLPTPSGTLTIDGDGFVEDDTYYVTRDYFKVFPQELIHGNSRAALADPNSLVITESLSKKVFGNENPVGLRVKLSSSSAPDDYTITGVIKDPPLNSYLKYSILARFSEAAEKNLDDFRNTVSYCFLRTEKPLELEQFQENSNRIFARRQYDLFEKNLSFDQYFEEVKKHQPLIMNIADLHLDSTLLFEASPPGKRLYLQIFMGIALFIIVLAAINYVNLSTAQASKRAKEIGMRKVLGSVRTNLITGLLSESLFLALFSWMIGILLAAFALEFMTSIGFSAFNVDVLAFKPLLLLMLAISILTGLGAGAYPAFFLSGFAPALVLKGNYTSVKGKSFARNVLVVFQFSISLSLAIFSIFISQQLNYGLGKDLGFDREQVMVVDNSKNQLDGSEEAFLNELRALSSVSEASLNRYSMIDQLAITGMLRLDGTEDYVQLYYKYVDANFVPTMGFEVLQGRNFDATIASDTAAIVVNESFAKELGGDAIGKEFNAYFLGERVRVIGVVKDFHFQNFSKQIEPAGFFYRNWGNQFNLRISAARAVNDVEEVWAGFTSEPFEYYFFDQQFNELFNSEKTLGQIITIFTSLSIFIAFLGFAGLISYQLDRRVKEIGIRKVLGASVGQILKMFSTEFSRLAVVSFIIGTPIAWFVTTQWLESFAYRIDIGVTPFLIAGIGGLTLILAIIFLRTNGKARINPAETLRSE